MNIESLVAETAERFDARKQKRDRNVSLIKGKRYLEADTPERVEKFLRRHGYSPKEAAELLRNRSRGAAAARETAAGRGQPDALERVLGANDLMGVAFLERGLQVARTVGRVWVGVSSGRPSGFGTGFLISPRLLMTNHHVLEDASVARASLVEFDYQLGLDNVFLKTTTFPLDPDEFFVNDRGLDFAVVAVKRTGTGGRELASFGWNPLIEEEGKAIISQWLNIIQHPNGEAKQLALRENQMIDLLDNFIHYKTDTAPGSSGSPVLNDRWEVVGLHHSGVWDTRDGQILAIDGRPWHRSMGEHRIKWKANEGVRISKIVAHLRKQPMSQAQKQMFEQIFAQPPAVAPREDVGASAPAPTPSARVTAAADGSATWTIPLSVTINLGGMGAPQQPAAPPYALPPAPDGRQPRPGGAPGPGDPLSHAAGAAGAPTPGAPASDLDSVVEAAKREFGDRADVLGVRLGYVFRDGWITDERAVVITVRRKQTHATLRESGIPPLPKSFMGLPVQVANPSIEDLIREREPAKASEAFSDAPVMREEITYNGPSGFPLEEVTANMRVIAHVSPDAGWPQLSRFLAATRRRLVIGVYDFGAPHVADAVEQAGRKANFRKLTLVMQKGESVGAGTKADDLRDTEVVEKFENALGSKFENAWVKIGRENGWVASSYHIKVAVRDSTAFWLSSGNMQSSNLPDADPISESPQQRSWLTTYNREWHAIVEHAGLAGTFEEYLKHDFRNNLGDGRETLALPDVLVPEAFFLPGPAEAARPFKYFPPFNEKRDFTVTPLLTPDNYHDLTLRLVKGAKRELLIQNQTFNAPEEWQDELKELVDAVIARQRAGVDVRIIFRLLDYEKVRKNLEALKDYGLDLSSVKVQKNCHTKGIVVDRERVLLGSQNWSNDGVSVNRDASLLFKDPPLASYFAEIFDHDWENLANKKLGSEWLPVEFAPAEGAAPEGMLRLTWKDYMEML